MSALTSQPINKNFLSPVGFKFGIKKLPNTNFFVQAANLPGRTLGFPTLPNPFKSIPIAGDHMKYNDFTMTFKVDEDMQNYLEIFDWMNGVGFPDMFNQYKNLDSKAKTSGEGVYSDGTLIVYTSSRNPGVEITFVDMFPHVLSDLVFDSRDNKIQYIDATVTFKYRKLSIKRLT